MVVLESGFLMNVKWITFAAQGDDFGRLLPIEEASGVHPTLQYMASLYRQEAHRGLFSDGWQITVRINDEELRLPLWPSMYGAAVPV